MKGDKHKIQSHDLAGGKLGVRCSSTHASQDKKETVMKSRLMRFLGLAGLVLLGTMAEGHGLPMRATGELPHAS